MTEKELHIEVSRYFQIPNSTTCFIGCRYVYFFYKGCCNQPTTLIVMGVRGKGASENLRAAPSPDATREAINHQSRRRDE